MDVPLNFAFSSIAKYAFVFTLGYLAGDHYQRYSIWLDRYGGIFVTPFLVLLAFAVPWGVPKFILGLLSIAACHAMVRMNSADFWEVFKRLGKYTFPIYLMNTAFIGLSKGVMLRFASWDGAKFFWFAPILLLVGVVGPILVKRWIIARSSVLNTIVA
jgi:membrane-bound acyltransferase YfiQ involved in biofilm formation